MGIGHACSVRFGRIDHTLLNDAANVCDLAVEHAKDALLWIRDERPAKRRADGRPCVARANEEDL
jgi:hypothetical protein